MERISLVDFAIEFGRIQADCASHVPQQFEAILAWRKGNNPILYVLLL